MIKKIIVITFAVIAFAMVIKPAHAQGDLAAVLEVLEAGVEVQRADTSNWLPVTRESIVGVGDSIRTDSTGRARITFFETGSDIEITPDSEIRINDYSGDDQAGYQTSLQVLAGITRQQVQRFANPASSFEVITPGMAMTVRGTDFDVRVEDTGRSALITGEGDVGASADQVVVPVLEGFGVRSEVGEDLSPVIPATSFEELDAGLDGFAATFASEGDVRLNVRLGPGKDFQYVGSILPEAIESIYGTDASGEWYRIAFREGFGWVSSLTLDLSFAVPVDETPLPVYVSDYQEDISRFTYIGEIPAEAVVVRPVVNLRNGPGVDFDVVQRMFDGDALSVLGRTADDDWLRVRLPDGQIGWVNASLLQINVDLNNVPIVDGAELGEPTSTPTATPSATPTPTATPDDDATDTPDDGS